MPTRELKNAIPTVAAAWPTRMVKSSRVRPRLASSASVAAVPVMPGKMSLDHGAARFVAPRSRYSAVRFKNPRSPSRNP